jgi:hypothetical protein
VRGIDSSLIIDFAGPYRSADDVDAHLEGQGVEMDSVMRTVAAEALDTSEDAFLVNVDLILDAVLARSLRATT